MKLNKNKKKFDRLTYDGSRIVKIGKKEVYPIVYVREFDFTNLNYYKSNKHGIHRAIHQYIGHSEDYNLIARTSKWTRRNINLNNDKGKLLRALIEMYKFKNIKELNKYVMDNTTILKRCDTVEDAKKLESTLISINMYQDANNKFIICLNERDEEVKISKDGKYVLNY